MLVWVFFACFSVFLNGYLLKQFMDVWYSQNLGDGMMACMPLGRIEDALALIVEKGDDQVDKAVFTRSSSEGSLHCEVYVYFSPALASMAKELGATPCSKPTTEGLSLFAGSEKSWQILFSET